MLTKTELFQRITSIETNAALLVSQANAAWSEIIILYQRLDDLAAAGMYTFAEQPTELWESRNGGDAKYLRLRWHETPTHCRYIDVARPFDGPNGQRQTYIGADPERIAEARLLVARRLQWLDLQSQSARHEQIITRINRQLLP